MASQFLTVAAIGGASSSVIWSILADWADARTTENPNEWCPSQWPTRVCSHIDRFVDHLNDNGCSPPVLYYSRHADTWSMGDVYDQLMRPPYLDEPLRLMSYRHELWAQPLGDGHPIAHHAAEIRHRSSDCPEYLWVATRLQEAAMVYNADLGPATLLLARTIVGGLRQDQDLMLEDVAPWITKIGG